MGIPGASRHRACAVGSGAVWFERSNRIARRRLAQGLQQLLQPLREGLAVLRRQLQRELDAAVAASRLTDRIVVFGSFYTVGGILRHGVPHMHGKHFDS